VTWRVEAVPPTPSRSTGPATGTLLLDDGSKIAPARRLMAAS
jgi:hypothetical protein